MIPAPFDYQRAGSVDQAIGFLGERISTVLIIGGILVLTGVVITERA